jgi:flagellin-like hook-associated protein FlgL
MSLTLSSNLAANRASQDLNKASVALRNSLNRLSSGNRIVSPNDDPGGMSVAYKLQSRMRRTEAVRHNVQNSISFLQVQDGVLSSAGNIASRMSELRTMAQDVTKNTSDIENYSKEFLELQKQLSQMYQEKFNGVSLFSISSAPSVFPPNGPAYNKGITVDENGNRLTNFSRTLYTHDSGQMDNGNVSIGATNFEDIFNLGALDARYVETFNGRFANLSNPSQINSSNYSTNPAISGSDPTLDLGVYGGAKSTGRGYGPNIGLVSEADYGVPLPDGVDGLFQLTTNFSGDAGNSYNLEVSLVSYASLAAGVVSDRTFAPPVPSAKDFTASSNTNVTNITNGLQTITVNGIDLRYQLLKLGANEAHKSANGGSNDYRLEVEVLKSPDGSGGWTVDSHYSLTDFKQMVESGSIFNLDTSQTVNPESWPMDAIQGFRDDTESDSFIAEGFNFSFSGGFDLDSIESASEESTSALQNAEVFTDDGYLSSILFVSMGQFTSVIERIADARAENGAEQSRMRMVDELLATNVTNLEAAHGRIMDADVAAESTKLARYNVMVQAAASMVAQANQLSSIALTLLGR